MRRRLQALALLALVGLGVSWAATRDDADPPAPRAVAPGATSTTPATSPAADPSSTVGTSSTTTAAVAPTDRFAVAAGGTAVVGQGPLRTYTVEVEEGIPVDPAAFAALVDATLGDPRGWTAAGDVALQRVGPGGQPSFRVRLATPPTVDAHCAPLVTNGIYSCRQGADVMINLDRWQTGAAPSGLRLAEYRHYVISHEVGHALGHGHVGCPSPGALAPVMLQQTKGLQGCAPNPWPFP